MALYSVWDWNRNSYRIYTTPTPVSVGDDPTSPKPTGISPIGANPDTDIKPLPSGATFVGYDQLAHGEIRREPGGFSDLGDDAGTPPFWQRPLIMFSAGIFATFWLADLNREYHLLARINCFFGGRMRSNRRRRRR